MVCNNNGLFQIDLTMADELEAADRWNKIQIQMEIQIQTQTAKQIYRVTGFREPLPTNIARIANAVQCHS